SNQDRGIGGPAGDFLLRAPVIQLHVTEPVQGVPRIVVRSQRAAVQHDDLHGKFPERMSNRQATRRTPGSPSTPSQVISRCTNRRTTSMFVNMCEVTSATRTSEAPSAKANGKTS